MPVESAAARDLTDPPVAVADEFYGTAPWVHSVCGLGSGEGCKPSPAEDLQNASPRSERHNSCADHRFHLDEASFMEALARPDYLEIVQVLAAH
jgi:hypothetical protein